MNDQNQLKAIEEAKQEAKAKAERNSRRYMMDKQTFVCCGYNEYIMEKREPKTHIEVTWDQMIFIQKDKDVNGPKVIHFYATMYGVPEADRKTAEMKMLRDEQARIDNGGAPYVPPVVAPVVAPEPAKENGKAPAEPLKPEENAAVAGHRATLMAMETKEQVLAHAETVFGVKLALHPNTGKAKAVEAVISAMQERSEAETKTV